MMDNAKQAFKNYQLWLSWYPGDIKGAIEFASDYLETEQDVNEFENEIKNNTKLKLEM